MMQSAGGRGSELGDAKKLSHVEAKVKQGFATIKDGVIGEDCNNCAKSTCNKKEDQYFCSDACYYEFNHKREACAQGKISKYGNGYCTPLLVRHCVVK